MTEEQATPTPTDSFRVLMAPMNFADQPMSLVRELNRRGIYARQVQYTATGRHPLGYELDRIVSVRTGDFARQLEILHECLQEGFDIFHFWQRSLLFRPDLKGLTGFDLPLIRSAGASVFHRFTGFDLRMPTRDAKFNPHSPFNHGYESPFDEKAQHEYIAMLRDYVDVFLVQDPEMGQFMPEAAVLPRSLEIDKWEFEGVKKSERPLVVHAPSNAAVKGSRFIINALENLQREGLQFDFKLLEMVPHEEARQWYRKADIIVDQIMIGATGVLTLEAWLLGKPCVTYLRPDLFEPFYECNDLPVANATPEDIESVLRKLIKDQDWREDLSGRGRELVERFHDSRKVADQYEQLCRTHLPERENTVAKRADLDFFVPRLSEFVQPPFPEPALSTEFQTPNNWVASCERWLYQFESAALKLLFRAQGFCFKALLWLQLRITRIFARSSGDANRQ